MLKLLAIIILTVGVMTGAVAGVVVATGGGSDDRVLTEAESPEGEESLKAFSGPERCEVLRHRTADGDTRDCPRLLEAASEECERVEVMKNLPECQRIIAESR